MIGPRRRRVVAGLLSLVLVANLIQSAPALATPSKTITKPPPVPAVPGTYVTPTAPVAGPTIDQVVRAVPTVTWPVPMTAEVPLPGPGKTASNTMTAVPGAPIRLAPIDGFQASDAPGSIRVQVLDHSTGAAT